MTRCFFEKYVDTTKGLTTWIFFVLQSYFLKFSFFKNLKNQLAGQWPKMKIWIFLEIFSKIFSFVVIVIILSVLTFLDSYTSLTSEVCPNSISLFLCNASKKVIRLSKKEL